MSYIIPVCGGGGGGGERWSIQLFSIAFVFERFSAPCFIELLMFYVND